MKQTTIVDLAKLLHITPSTVSRALRNHSEVSSKTKAKVLALAKKMDYHPNSIAQNLKQKKSNIIGVLVPQVRHYFFASIMSGITDVAEKAGLTVMICQSNDKYKNEVRNISSLISQRIAGLLVSISSATENFDHFESLINRKIPVVFFDRIWDDKRVSKVDVDDYNGAFQIVEHMILRGYKKIAHITGPGNLNISKQRLKGYKDALEKHNIDFHEKYIIHAGLNEEDGGNGISLLMKLPDIEKPDAVFCITDPVAIGAFLKIKELGLKIPEDIALGGFSDNPNASLITPSLTTVRQPAYELGKEAAEILIKQIQDHNWKPVNKMLNTELIIREST